MAAFDYSIPFTKTKLATEAEPETKVTFGEIQVSEYVIFLLALDTYMRYVEETTGETPADALTTKGLRLLRIADTLHLEEFQGFVSGHLPQDAQKKMLVKALRLRPTADGAARRALQLRTVLSRGGTGTMRAVFQTNKALQNVRAAISASMVDDADAALDKFAVIGVRNAKLRDWIDEAAAFAGSGTPPTPIASVSVGGTVDDAASLLKAKVEEEGSSATSQQGAASRTRSEDILQTVQSAAQDTASKNLRARGEEDTAPTKSEVVGIATAAVVAAMGDPADEKNIPESLRKLDPEQRMAAMTDGRVLIAASAGAGKSSTLVARIKYLVNEKKTNPTQILACSFNKKAADELKGKIAKALGFDARSNPGVQVGTIHGLFYKFIVGDRQTQGYGTAEEQAMLKPPRLIAPPKGGVKSVNPIALTSAIRGAWGECQPEVLASLIGVPKDWFKGGAPKAKKAGLYLNAWRGNDIGLAEAKVQGKNSPEEAQAAVWYEFYLGIKGDIPGWKPPCGPSKAITSFTDKHRKSGERLGDLSDMLKVFRDILRRDPRAKQAIQATTSHYMVDEAQDLNVLGHQVFEMLSEQVKPDSKDKSIWLVGDEKQAINAFQGGRAELFTSMHGKEGWKTRIITTNYRCEPEIVEAANRLALHNDVQIPMEARANPTKARGKSSIEVSNPPDATTAALDTIGTIRKDLDVGGAQAEDYAVLARTNAELNDFETACIINEIPYIRKGGKGFLEAPESKALLGYIDLVSGTDYAKMQGSLVSALTKPDRGLYLGPDDVLRAVTEAIDDVARKEGVDKRMVSPATLLESKYVYILADRLKQPYKLKIIGGARDPKQGEWIYGKRVDELVDNLRGLKDNLADLKDFSKSKDKSSVELLDFVLDGMKSEVGTYDRGLGKVVMKKTSLREQISHDTGLFSDDELDDEKEETVTLPEVGPDGQLLPKEKEVAMPGAGLGAVQFLYELAKPSENDLKHGTDPSLAQGLVSKLGRYSALAETLRIDPDKWERDQSNLADADQRRSKPPAVTLSTVHSSKGMEYLNVTVMMPKGKFPMERKVREGEPPPSLEEAEAQMKAERNLAYVAITRAAVNLDIVCPGKKGVLSSFVYEAGLVEGQNVEKGGLARDLKTASDSGLDETYVADSLLAYAPVEPVQVHSYGRRN